MASRSALLGMVPVWMQPPPIMSRRSTTATRLPSLAAATAAFWPAGPLPITARSYIVSAMRSSPFPAVGSEGRYQTGDGALMKGQLRLDKSDRETY